MWSNICRATNCCHLVVWTLCYGCCSEVGRTGCITCNSVLQQEAQKENQWHHDVTHSVKDDWPLRVSKPNITKRQEDKNINKKTIYIISLDAQKHSAVQTWWRRWEKWGRWRVWQTDRLQKWLLWSSESRWAPAGWRTSRDTGPSSLSCPWMCNPSLSQPSALWGTRNHNLSAQSWMTG